MQDVESMVDGVENVKCIIYFQKRSGYSNAMDDHQKVSACAYAGACDQIQTSKCESDIDANPANVGDRYHE